MTSGPDRDQALERLLRESMRPDDIRGDHLDAETAAAWVERRLGSREAAAVESHVGSCGRCQQMVAMIVQTVPAAGVADDRPRWRLAWLVPIGATAAALAIWLAVGPRGGPTVLVEQTAEHTAPAPDQPLERADAREKALAATSKAPAAPAPPAPPAGDARTLADNGRPADAAKNADPPERANAARTDQLQKAEARDVSATGTFTAAPSAAGTVAPEPATNTAAPPDAARRAAPSSPAPAAAAAARVGNDAATRSARSGVDILSIDPLERWRSGGPGVLQHSIDGGRSWTITSIAAGLQITAGSSPAASVCWLAGRAGVVMLTTDGQTWRRLPFPVTVDLVSIRATDAVTATVSTADGRSFQTSDAGQTWR